MEAVRWLDANSGFVMAVLTLVYVIATFYIMKANLTAAIEMKRAREDESRPYVVVYMQRDAKVHGAVHLVIRNIGKTVACAVQIRTTPTIEHPAVRPLSKSTLLTREIPNIPPEFTIDSFVGMMSDMKQHDGSFPVYNFSVSYTNGGGRTFSEEYISDLNTESDLLRLSEKSFDDFAKDFELFRRDSVRAINQVIQLLSSDATTSQLRDSL